MILNKHALSNMAIRQAYFAVGCFCCLGLLILAGIFFKERIIFADTALQEVYLLIEQRPCINPVRPGAILPQIIPLTAIWLHSSIPAVMLLHSLSFIIFFGAIYIIAYRHSRTSILFFLIPVYLLLITSRVFYYPQSELQQGMVWLCLYAVFLYEGVSSDAGTRTTWLIHFISMVWIQFFHPLMIFPILFLLVYYHLEKMDFLSKKTVILFLICLLSFVLRYIIGMLDSYEHSRLSLNDISFQTLLRLFSLVSVKSFLDRVHNEYALYICALVLAVVWLFASGKTLKAIWLICSTIAYWLLIMISLHSNDSFYTENLLLPLGFIAALPWVADILPEYRSIVIVILFSIALISRFFFIYIDHTEYTERLYAYQPYFNYINSKNLKGVFVDEKQYEKEKLVTTWASGYESMLISSFYSPDSCKIVQIDRMAEANSGAYYRSELNNDTAIVTRHRIWEQIKVPKRYFNPKGGKYEMYPQDPGF